MTGLFLPQSTLDAMVAQAEAKAPVQACGLLSGQERIVQALHEMTNGAPDSGHFCLLPEEVQAVDGHARNEHREILAVYHSRLNGPARPTAHDLVQPVPTNVVFLILSLLDRWNPELRGFRIHNGQAVEVPVMVFNDRECDPVQDYTI